MWRRLQPATPLGRKSGRLESRRHVEQGSTGSIGDWQEGRGTSRAATLPQGASVKHLKSFDMVSHHGDPVPDHGDVQPSSGLDRLSYLPRAPHSNH